MLIRNYLSQDRRSVEEICAPQKDAMSEAMLNCFCRYYIEHEPENCFVCEENGTVQGYVLCSESFSVWESGMADYARCDPISAAIAEATATNLRPYADEYPAHLHIDLAPAAQGKGYGTMLMNRLCERLRQRGTAGVMLDVAVDNTGAQRFYERCGFCVLCQNGQSIQMGKRL